MLRNVHKIILILNSFGDLGLTETHLAFSTANFFSEITKRFGLFKLTLITQ